MEIKVFSSMLKKLLDFVPRRDIEKLIFKILLGAWLIIIVLASIFKAGIGVRDDIERKITEAARGVKPQLKDVIDVGKYEALLNLTKYPEGIDKYVQAIYRDPFSEYKEVTVKRKKGEIKYDFVLKAVKQMPLPAVYKGFIELEDKIIGQINWHDATRFVETGSSLNGYKIQSVSREMVVALDGKGQRIEFKLNKPVLGDELEAVLYDNVSRKTFNVGISSEIDEYKVIDIAPNYVILLLKGKEIRLDI